MPASARTRWTIVVVYAIAMAWVESACVYYLRVVVGAVDQYQAVPLSIPGSLGAVELVREAATLLMLLTMGALVGQTFRSRLAYTVIAFGVWDIFYYVFLKVICGWPKSLLDWDLLFLLPLPWWGPVLAPVCIAALMIVWGTLVTQFDPIPDGSFTSPVWRVTCAGVLLALYVFMADSLAAVSRGMGISTIVVPTAFNWSAFLIALALIAAPIVDMLWRRRPAKLPFQGR